MRHMEGSRTFSSHPPPGFQPPTHTPSRMHLKVRSEGKIRPSYQPKILRCSKIGLLIHSVTGTHPRI